MAIGSGFGILGSDALHLICSASGQSMYMGAGNGFGGFLGQFVCMYRYLFFVATEVVEFGLGGFFVFIGFCAGLFGFFQFVANSGDLVVYESGQRFP